LMDVRKSWDEAQREIDRIKSEVATTFEVGHKDGRVVINVYKDGEPSEHFVWTPTKAREIAHYLRVAAEQADPGPHRGQDRFICEACFRELFPAGAEETCIGIITPNTRPCARCGRTMTVEETRQPREWSEKGGPSGT
jgi:hypothetical protein